MTPVPAYHRRIGDIAVTALSDGYLDGTWTTGSGDYLLPTAGKLQQNLAAAEIETVILTHLHPDHAAGLTDPKTCRKLFPNTELVLHENEPRH